MQKKPGTRKFKILAGFSSLQANDMNNKYCFVIVGPTAVGKTSFAIQLAKYLATQIISADSRQCYQELNIGVAKPQPAQLAEIKHYFIGSHSIHQQVNARVFETYAMAAAEIIFEKNDVAVVVGGTGLYINAFSNGLDDIPLINTDIQNEIATGFALNGIGWLQNEVEKEDAVYFKKGETMNPHRLMRALEVKLSTGRSITEFQKGGRKKRSFKIIKIGLELVQEQLHKNINHRVNGMLQQGLLKEVTGLLPYKELNALNTVGYKEIFAYLQGQISLEESLDKIVLNTRHYAKRQLTWFKKDKEIKWIDASIDNHVLLNLCEQLIPVV